MTFFPSPSLQAPGVDPRSIFAREAEAVVRACLDLTEVHYDPARFALIFTTGTGEKCFSLLNVFSETRDMLPEKRRERIAFFARASEEHEDATESPWPVVAPRLVPLLRPVSVESGLLQVSAKGLDLFVAPYQALDTDAIGPLSVTTWIKGGDSLLPITDFVAFDRKDGSPSRMVPWAAVTAYAWAHLQAWGSDPPRIRTLGWPDDAVLRQLDAHAVRHQTG